MEKKMAVRLEDTLGIVGEGKEDETKNILASKKKGDSHLVAILVIIVITLALCYVFKNEVTGFMEQAFDTMGKKMEILLGNLI